MKRQYLNNLSTLLLMSIFEIIVIDWLFIVIIGWSFIISWHSIIAWRQIVIIARSILTIHPPINPIPCLLKQAQQLLPIHLRHPMLLPHLFPNPLPQLPHLLHFPHKPLQLSLLNLLIVLPKPLAQFHHLGFYLLEFFLLVQEVLVWLFL